MAAEKNDKSADKSGAQQNEVARAMQGDADKAQKAKNDEAAAMQSRIDEQAKERRRIETEEMQRAQARVAAERIEQEKLRPLPPITQSVGGSFARPNEDTVDMVFPRPMFIWAEPTDEIKKRHKVSFGVGIQPVPVSLRDNWYLRESGVKTLEEVRSEDARRREEAGL